MPSNQSLGRLPEMPSNSYAPVVGADYSHRHCQRFVVLPAYLFVMHVCIIVVFSYSFVALERSLKANACPIHGYFCVFAADSEPNNQAVEQATERSPMTELQEPHHLINLITVQPTTATAEPKPLRFSTSPPAPGRRKAHPSSANNIHSQISLVQWQTR
ncbi:uncharacterized protein LY79DRAFT_224272 [Colletotrichum navitas]|uniref:Uncharacterized protein n=1 Tax=Colletotrichum navitas TaxID=681940 RepID=A0AAD8V4A3_9PEZI|nr:uncharacterized protein LY79DRAFT_224272 [Colletotrichum navitas]KAK1590192.1 hypothetical protein LY79DRAFT_224272 [Colletotrichum navitas]